MTEIRIPWDPARASLNVCVDWRARKRLRDAAKEAATIGYRLAGSPSFAEPITLSLLVRRGRVMDVDNAVAGMKACVDQLVRLGLTRDDSRRWVQWGSVEFETGKRWRDRPEVLVRVSPAPPAR